MRIKCDWFREGLLYYYYLCYHLYAGYLQLYTAETNHVSRVYSVAAVLYVQSVLHAMLYRK
jgi:hypothetical protein